MVAQLSDYILRHQTDFNVLQFIPVFQKIAVNTFTEQATDAVINMSGFGGQYTKPVYLGELDLPCSHFDTHAVGIRFNWTF